MFTGEGDTGFTDSMEHAPPKLAATSSLTSKTPPQVSSGEKEEVYPLRMNPPSRVALTA